MPSNFFQPKNHQRVFYIYIYIYQYSMSSTLLNTVQIIKDLGLLLDIKLSFKSQIDHLICQSCKLLRFALRFTADFNNVHCYRRIFNLMIISKLDCVSVIWNLFQNFNIHGIEKILIMFRKIIYNRLHHHSHNG